MSSGTELVAKTLTFILAGGEGERLYPLTAHQPKPVVPFGGVFRIIDFTLSNVLNSGLRRIYLLTQYEHQRLHSYVRDGWHQLSNEFRWDSGEDMMCLAPCSGKRYRGTADAVFQNLGTIEKSGAEYVLIVSGDQVYHMDYSELLHRHCASGADVTMAAVQYLSNQPPRLASSNRIMPATPSDLKRNPRRPARSRAIRATLLSIWAFTSSARKFLSTLFAKTSTVMTATILPETSCPS